MGNDCLLHLYFDWIDFGEHFEAVNAMFCLFVRSNRED